MIRELLTRLRFFLARRNPGDLDEELTFHVEQSTQANMAAGMTAEEARRRALMAFGSVERVREECWEQRPGWFVETVMQDVRYAFREFRRKPVLAATVIATLALGIGATTAVFSVVDPILFRGLPYAHPDRLVSVGLIAPIIPQEFMLGGSYYEWRDNQKPFAALTSETGVNGCDLTEHNPRHLSCARVESTFLPTLGISPVLGRNFLPAEDRPNGPKVALISYGLWRAHYSSDPGVVGRLVEIDGTPVQVIGVLPEDFEMPTLEAADIVVPQALDQAAQRKADPGSVMYAFARLKPAVSTQQAEAALEPLFEYSLSLVPPAFRKEVHLRVRSIRDRQMHDVRLIAWVLLAAVLAVLLIACTNVASLFMARGAARERDLAVRSALGATRGRLTRQALTEALLVSVAGALVGSVLAEILLRIFMATAPAGIPFLSKAKLDLRIVLFTVLISLLCGVVFGMISALQQPRSRALAAHSTKSRAHAVLRRVLVTGQIAISLVLLSGAALLLRSFRNLQQQNLGIETRGVLVAEISLPRYRYSTAQKQMEFFQQAETAVRRLPGVTAAAVSDTLPPGGTHHDQIYSVIAIPGKPRPKSGTGGMVTWRSVTPDYFRTLDIPVIRGRGFTEEQRSLNDHFVILSSLLAFRLFANEDPVGQRVQLSPDGPLYMVVGVAANVKNAGLAAESDPEYYRLRRNAAEDWESWAAIVLKTVLSPAATAPWVRSQVEQIDPTVPVEIETLNERVSQLADRPRFETALLGFFAVSGLLMAIIGLYGVISFVAIQRTQEIGVRMALGARRIDILRLITWEGVRLTLLGGVAGLSVALAVSHLLKSLLYSVGPYDPSIFVTAALLLAVVALAATLIPALAATKVEPVVALRYE